jgi:hypothetical protein
MPIVAESPGVATRTRSKSAFKPNGITKDTKLPKLQPSENDEEAAKVFTKKRKRETVLPTSAKTSSTHQISNEEEMGCSPKKEKKGAHGSRKDEYEEKRQRVFRKKAPQSYLERLSRAISQRFVHRAEISVG